MRNWTRVSRIRRNPRPNASLTASKFLLLSTIRSSCCDSLLLSPSMEVSFASSAHSPKQGLFHFYGWIITLLQKPLKTWRGVSGLCAQCVNKRIHLLCFENLFFFCFDSLRRFLVRVMSKVQVITR